MPSVQNTKQKITETVKDLVFYIVGSSLTATSICMFTAPNHIAPGGVSGVSTVINYLSGWPIGLLSFLLNIPILLWAFWEIGYKMVAKTFVATVILSAAIDILGCFIQPYRGSPMLAAIFGGCLDGVGLSLVFLRGATTGGTDLIARLLERHIRSVSMGKLMMAVDGMIVIISGFVYKSMESVMYAIIAIFVSSRLIDTVLYGTDIGTGKVLFIISEKNDLIAQEILSDVDRGVTVLKSRGAYTGHENEVLLCVVRRYEVAKVKDIVHSIDKKAFLIVGDAGEITGEGFRPVGKDDKTLKEILHDGKKGGGSAQ